MNKNFCFWCLNKFKMIYYTLKAKKMKFEACKIVYLIIKYVHLKIWIDNKHVWIFVCDFDKLWSDENF